MPEAISNTSPLLYLFRIGIVLLDDALARRVAQAAGLQVWGTLRVLLEGKNIGLTDSIKPLLERLTNSGMWISSEVRTRILALADES